MRKGKSVIGQDIYSVSAGLKVESVKDLVLEDGEDGVVALLVSAGGLLGTSRIVPFGSVVRFGPSAVMIDDANSVIPATGDPRVSEIIGRRSTLVGTRVVTEAGEDLGRIGDLYFEEASGRITGYEVSGGLLGDAMHGTSYLPFEHIRVIGRDAVIASSEARPWSMDRRAASPPHSRAPPLRARQPCRVMATMRRPRTPPPTTPTGTWSAPAPRRTSSTGTARWSSRMARR